MFPPIGKFVPRDEHRSPKGTKFPPVRPEFVAQGEARLSRDT
jgi:hypothetical protein